MTVYIECSFSLYIMLDLFPTVIMLLWQMSVKIWSTRKFEMERKTGRGVSAGGGQSSLGYLFGGGEAPKPANVSTPPAEKLAPTSQSVDISKQVPAGIQVQASQTNNYHRAEGQNTGNFLTVFALSLYLSVSRRYLLFRG